jgi:hypothetical protein
LTDGGANQGSSTAVPVAINTFKKKLRSRTYRGACRLSPWRLRSQMMIEVAVEVRLHHVGRENTQQIGQKMRTIVNILRAVTFSNTSD